MKKIYLFSCLLFVYTSNIFGQANIDSLLQQLEEVKGREKVDVLLTIGTYYGCQKNADTLLLYANQSLALSQEYDYPLGALNSYIKIGIANDLKGVFTNSMNSYNQAIVYATQLNDLKGLCAIYANIGVSHQRNNLSEQAIEYFLKARDLAITYEVHNVVINTYINLGIIYYEFGEFHNSIDNLQSAISYIAEKQLPPDAIASATATIYLNLVSAYLDNNLIDSAKIYIDKGYLHCKENQYARGIRNLNAKSVAWLVKKKGLRGSHSSRKKIFQFIARRHRDHGCL